jgi:lipopolysaccharide transport system permease protein
VQSTDTLAAVSAAPAAARAVRRIKPSSGLIPIDLHELWSYRALLYLFTLRDIKTRYRQTYLSGFWAIFRPISSMVLFSVIFGGLAGIKSGSGVPYPLFVYTGVLAWTYFQSAAGSGVSAIGANGGLIGKAYFPRLYAPIAVVTAPLVDFVLAFAVLLGLFGWYQTWPSWHIVFLPLFLLLAVVLAFSLSLWLSGASVKYRDIAFGIPFLLQIWLYLTPVIYPASLVPGRYRWLLSLNPMTAVIDGFRWSLLGSGFPSARVLGVAIAVTLGLFVPGLFFFRRSERTVADLM